VSGKDFFYKGVNKVKVVTESEGYWIVEAMEDFVDYLDGQRVTVKVGERRMVPPETLTNEMVLLPPVKEHVYERKMERKLMQIVEDEEEKQKQTRQP
jgi:hypothetical protein